MKPTIKIILFGILIWICVFIGAMFIFKLHDSDRIFFETLISIIFISCVMLCTTFYFTKVKTDFVREGIKTGVIWPLVNLAIDIPIFALIMKQPLVDYFKDIGLIYLAIPIITISTAYLLNMKAKK